jgi:hypothetical protein
LVSRCKYKFLVQVSSKFEDTKMKFYQILLDFKPRSFFEFSFKIHFKSEEVSIEKVVPLLKPFKTIFYLKQFNPEKVLFGSKEIRTGLKFEFNFV